MGSFGVGYSYIRVREATLIKLHQSDISNVTVLLAPISRKGDLLCKYIHMQGFQVHGFPE